MCHSVYSGLGKHKSHAEQETQAMVLRFAQSKLHIIGGTKQTYWEVRCTCSDYWLRARS